MVLRHLVQVALTGASVVGRAFQRALQKEMAASRQAAARQADKAPESSPSDRRRAATANARFGLSLQEAQQILHIPDTPLKDIDPELYQQRYDYLFKANEKGNGGTLYLQSKVFRAKERIDYELNQAAPPPPPPPQDSPSPPPPDSTPPPTDSPKSQ